MIKKRKLNTSFDWLIYADATFAGLSVLIPIPMLDWLVEVIFKRRMARTIAKRRGKTLEPHVLRAAGREPSNLFGCFLWPFILVFEFAKRLSRTILYFLTINASANALSYYWHRAFLLDYCIQNGHFDDASKLDETMAAFHVALDETNTSPLLGLAQQILSGASEVVSTAWNWVRRREENETVTTTKANMAQAWDGFSEHFVSLANRYEDVRNDSVSDIYIAEAPIDIKILSDDDGALRSTGSKPSNQSEKRPDDEHLG